ncbi:uncharacterized protein KQ657_002433 [Scheffersomyces spartinae]|uniref:Striatin N-terminal domain-containing protein n=1 Tax=Scheffersomyces spartinae TaxID=45513 RepID=A0A9P8AHF0_9ASCO|nr:uncharacterized protein KQ657_002433 [Scheffersomyces spartinae]KAG7192073.1 hypothetical protein KQ657_002433 [Scheffersomyces spartinae]
MANNSVLPHLQSSQRYMQKLGHVKLAVGQLLLLLLQQLQQQGGNGNGNSKPVYTLPGVISYLTSEFTNLERFKIMTNLEKSEMKHRILELQGEVNALTYVNKRQQNRIKDLEKENGRLRATAAAVTAVASDDVIGDVPGEGDDGINRDFGDDCSGVPDIVKSDVEMFKLEIDGLPEIDLQDIKNLRDALAKSMKEILDLLKAPTARSAVSEALGNPDSFIDNYDVLAEAPEPTSSNHPHPHPHPHPHHHHHHQTGQQQTSHESGIDSFVFNSVESSGPDLGSAPSKYESDTETVVLDGFNDSDNTKTGSSSYELEVPSKLDSMTISPPSPARINEMAFIDYSNDNKYSNTRKFFHGAYVLILAYKDTQAKVSIWSPTKLSSYEIELESPHEIIEAYCLNPEDSNAKLIVIYSTFGVGLSLCSDEEDNEKYKFELDSVGTSCDLYMVGNSDQLEFYLLLSGDNRIKTYRVKQQPGLNEKLIVSDIRDISCEELGIGLIQETHWLRGQDQYQDQDQDQAQDAYSKIIVTGDSFIAKVDMITHEVQTLKFDDIKISAFVNEHQVIVTKEETTLVDLSKFQVSAKLQGLGDVLGVTVLESSGHVYLVRLSNEGVLSIFDEKLQDAQEIPVHRDSKSIGSIKGLIVLDSPQKNTLYVYDLPTLRFMYS